MTRSLAVTLVAMFGLAMAGCNPEPGPANQPAAAAHQPKHTAAASTAAQTASASSTASSRVATAATERAAPTHVSQALAKGAGSGCKAFVAAVQHLCMATISEGLDSSCSEQLVRVSLLRERAGGSLLSDDTKRGKQPGVERACTNYLGLLRQAIPGTARQTDRASGPECASFARHFKQTCLADIARTPRSSNCKTAITAFEVGDSGQATGTLCTVADSFLTTTDGSEPMPTESASGLERHH